MWSAAAATPLADSTPSNHDNPQCARNRTLSLGDRGIPLLGPARLAPWLWGGAVAPCDRDLRNKDTAACCRALWGLLLSTVVDQRPWAIVCVCILTGQQRGIS